mmetsp:Transcript_15056/g.21498  ORF Transcript_15056/g.21498 Transcript_15056/m.21498 type:complete len:798 (-) Transcript_15056:161-2554(-)
MSNQTLISTTSVRDNGSLESTELADNSVASRLLSSEPKLSTDDTEHFRNHTASSKHFDCSDQTNLQGSMKVFLKANADCKESSFTNGQMSVISRHGSSEENETDSSNSTENHVGDKYTSGNAQVNRRPLSVISKPNEEEGHEASSLISPEYFQGHQPLHLQLTKKELSPKSNIKTCNSEHINSVLDILSPTLRTGHVDKFSNSTHYKNPGEGTFEENGGESDNSFLESPMLKQNPIHKTEVKIKLFSNEGIEKEGTSSNTEDKIKLPVVESNDNVRLSAKIEDALNREKLKPNEMHINPVENSTVQGPQMHRASHEIKSYITSNQHNSLKENTSSLPKQSLSPSCLKYDSSIPDSLKVSTDRSCTSESSLMNGEGCSATSTIDLNKSSDILPSKSPAKSVKTPNTQGSLVSSPGKKDSSRIPCTESSAKSCDKTNEAKVEENSEFIITKGVLLRQQNKNISHEMISNFPDLREKVPTSILDDRANHVFEKIGRNKEVDSSTNDSLNSFTLNLYKTKISLPKIKESPLAMKMHHHQWQTTNGAQGKSTEKKDNNSNIKDQPQDFDKIDDAEELKNIAGEDCKDDVILKHGMYNVEMQPQVQQLENIPQRTVSNSKNESCMEKKLSNKTFSDEKNHSCEELNSSHASFQSEVATALDSVLSEQVPLTDKVILKEHISCHAGTDNPCVLQGPLVYKDKGSARLSSNLVQKKISDPKSTPPLKVESSMLVPEESLHMIAQMSVFPSQSGTYGSTTRKDEKVQKTNIIENLLQGPRSDREDHANIFHHKSREPCLQKKTKIY